MESTKGKVSDIRIKCTQCLEDRTKLNYIIDIICHSQDDDVSVALAAVRGLQQIFTRFLSTKVMVTSQKQETVKGLSKEENSEQLSAWLQQQYRTTCDALVENLSAAEAKLQEASLVTLIKFIELEGKNPVEPLPAGQLGFAEQLLQAVMDKLLSKTDNNESHIQRLSEVTEYDDVRFFVMKAVKRHLAKAPVKERSEVYMCNVLCSLEHIELPDSDTSEPLKKFLTTSESHLKLSAVGSHKKLFTSCWMEFLRSELTASLYRRVLVKLEEKVITFMTSPLLLADFLTESYNVGGAISLLALNGLFTLIHRYNLDYPDFYKKFYSLFEPQIFHVKYRARFFYLADLFLSSTHLPGYLVAAFIKRVARLALTAPPAGAHLCVIFVSNLMVRHPSCCVLAHRLDYTMDNDPFLMEESDPAKTKAMDSSLWEIKTLQSHYSPEVALEAMKINHPIKQEQLLSDFLEDTTEQMMERPVKKLKTSVPIRPDKPGGLWDPSFKRFFTLE